LLERAHRLVGLGKVEAAERERALERKSAAVGFSVDGNAE
jgi:hypothetical protein